MTKLHSESKETGHLMLHQNCHLF